MQTILLAGLARPTVTQGYAEYSSSITTIQPTVITFGLGGPFLITQGYVSGGGDSSVTNNVTYLISGGLTHNGNAVILKGRSIIQNNGRGISSDITASDEYISGTIKENKYYINRKDS